MYFWPFRLRWRRTWPDRPNDFFARVGQHRFCRIERIYWGPEDGPWKWTASRDVHLGSGFADTAREAAIEAERVYFQRDKSVVNRAASERLRSNAYGG